MTSWSIYNYDMPSISERWVEVRYNTNVTVPCPVPTADFTSRQWYTWPYSLHLIYNQTTDGVTEGRRSRDDMSLDAATFHLTIGRVGLHDYIFSCVTIKQQTGLLGIIFIVIYRECFKNWIQEISFD